MSVTSFAEQLAQADEIPSVEAGQTLQLGLAMRSAGPRFSFGKEAQMIEGDRGAAGKFAGSAGQPESTLLPMLVAGLFLIVAGLIVVSFFV